MIQREVFQYDEESANSTDFIKVDAVVTYQVCKTYFELSKELISVIGGTTSAQRFTRIN